MTCMSRYILLLLKKKAQKSKEKQKIEVKGIREKDKR